MNTSSAPLHDAILHGLREKLAYIKGLAVEVYPERLTRLPALCVLIEVSEIEPGDDPGTGESAFIFHFQARAIVNPACAMAMQQTIDLGTSIAVALHNQRWGMPITPVKIVQMGWDSTKPELDEYLVWLVEWTHQIHLGEPEWPWPDESGKTIMIGLYPDVGPGNEDKYAEWKGNPDDLSRLGE